MSTEVTTVESPSHRIVARAEEILREEMQKAGFLTPGDGGKVHPHRGKGKENAFFDLALNFVTMFPAGSEIDQAQFDNWVTKMRESDEFRDRAEKIGLYAVPPEGTPKNSAEQALYLRKRNELRYNMNKAGSTPDMINSVAQVTGETGYGFQIEVPKQGKLCVSTCLDAFVDSAVSTSLETWIRSEQKRLRYLQQSYGYDGLDARDREDLDDCAEEIGYFGDDTIKKHSRLQAKCYRARARIERKIAPGAKLPELATQMTEETPDGQTTEIARPSSAPSN